MCVVSMVGDHYKELWDRPSRTTWPTLPDITYTPAVSREEFDTLRRQVEEMVELLKRAKQYDIDNNEPDCEVEDKMKFLIQVAKSVGIDLEKELQK